MKVTQAFANCGIEELKALLDGGTLTVYSVARPLDPDSPLTGAASLPFLPSHHQPLDPRPKSSKAPLSLKIRWQRNSWEHQDLRAPVRRTER